MIDIVLCASGADEVRLVHDLSTAHRGECRVVRRCADLAEVMGAAAAGVGDVVVLDLGTRGLDRDILAQLLHSASAVVGIAADAPDGSPATTLGLRSVISAGASGDELLAAVRQALATDEPGAADEPEEWAQEPAERGTVIAVWGPAGAPGRSTVAANLAHEAALAGVSTVLVDADTYGPCLTQMLGVLDDSPGLVAASRASARDTLDDATLDSLVPSIAPGLRILGGIGVAARWAELRPDSLPGVWEALASIAQLVVIDTGFALEEDEELSYDTLAPRRNAAATSAIAAADAVVAVTAAEPIGLTRLLRERERLAELGAKDLRVVVNRASKGDRTDQILALIRERMTGASISVLPEDVELCSRALWDGTALAEAGPRSALRRAIADLVMELPIPQITGAAASRTADAPGLLARLRGRRAAAEPREKVGA